jgi:hypothetical protein
MIAQRGEDGAKVRPRSTAELSLFCKKKKLKRRQQVIETAGVAREQPAVKEALH